MKKNLGRKSAPSDLPYPFTGLKVMGWVGGGWLVAYKILLSAPVPIGIGIRGLGLGLDNIAELDLHRIYYYIRSPP